MDCIPFPRVLRIELASQCNLACMHCPTGTIDMTRKIMKDEIFEKILQEVKIHKNDIKVIVLYHGGEPFLNKNFSRIVTALKEIDSSFFIKTVSNGMLMTFDRAKELTECSLDAIEFSLDGISSEENQFIRRKSDTDTVILNIMQLIKLKKEHSFILPHISISTTQFFSKNYPLVDYPKASTPKWLLEIFSNEDVEFKSTYAMKWPHMGDLNMFDTLEVTDMLETKKECDHIINTITVRADGSLVPCCFDLTSQLIMGSIYDKTLNEIWNGDKYRDLRKSISEKKFTSICNHCLVVKSPVYLIPKWNEKQI